MDAVFIEMAMRIEAMTPEGIEQETIYNLAFGALYALAQAERHGYPEQSPEEGRSKRRADEVRQLAAEMANHKSLSEDMDGEWLGGFYFNDALFRGTVCFEHAQKYCTKLKGRRAQERKSQDEKIVAAWPEIKTEVGALKHRSWEFGEGPTIPYPKAVKIIQEVVKVAELVCEHSS